MRQSCAASNMPEVPQANLQDGANLAIDALLAAAGSDQPDEPAAAEEEEQQEQEQEQDDILPDPVSTRYVCCRCLIVAV